MTSTIAADPRYQAARDRYVADPAEGETPDDAFARRCLAAYEMYLLETGSDASELDPAPNLGESLAAYGIARRARPSGFAVTNIPVRGV